MSVILKSLKKQFKSNKTKLEKIEYYLALSFTELVKKKAEILANIENRALCLELLKEAANYEKDLNYATKNFVKLLNRKSALLIEQSNISREINFLEYFNKEKKC